MSSTYRTTEGIVLKKNTHGENDFWARILTKDFGKQDFKLKGARKISSKLNPNIDILDFVLISFVKNGDNPPTVIDSEKISSNQHWFFDKEKLFLAANIIKTIDEIIPFEAKDQKFFLLVKNFFSSYSNDGFSFVRSILNHEGYSELSSLPPTSQDFIMKTWHSKI